MAVLLTWTKSNMPVFARVCLSGDQTALHLGQYVPREDQQQKELRMCWFVTTVDVVTTPE